MIRRVSDVQEITLEALWNNDNKLLFSAFLLDPLVNISRNIAIELFEKMLIASRYRP